MIKNKKCQVTNETNCKLIFSYNAPLLNEISIKSNDDQIYKREIWQYFPSRHLVSVHSMNLDGIYKGEYLDATYTNQKLMIETYNRIISLPVENSDNFWRFESIKNFNEKWLPKKIIPNLLDIGSGTGVFPFIVKKNGWTCSAIDPDPRSIDHIKKNIGVKGFCGDFMELKAELKYNIITLNKVLEHVEYPVEMLTKVKEWLEKDGFVYIELPDGEMAEKIGKEREEFTIDHLNIFSIASTAILASRAGFKVEKIYRIKEPSSKYTIRAYLSNI